LKLHVQKLLFPRNIIFTTPRTLPFFAFCCSKWVEIERKFTRVSRETREGGGVLVMGLETYARRGSPSLFLFKH